MKTEKEYIGPYKVVKFFRVSQRRQVLKRGLTKEEAKRVVNSYPDSNNHLVGFTKQFTSDRYYK
jgi:hypothetical protein